MTIAESLLPEFDHEMKTTRSLLQLVPGKEAEWKPHAKSSALGALATHLANLPRWVLLTMTQTELDLNPPGAERPVPPRFESTSKALQTFDDLVRDARAAIEGATDEELMVPWTLKSGGRQILSMPRLAILRSFVMNHLIHHRGQLSVYLRMKDVPLPSIYGPTADDTAGF